MCLMAPSINEFADVDVTITKAMMKPRVHLDTHKLTNNLANLPVALCVAFVTLTLCYVLFFKHCHRWCCLVFFARLLHCGRKFNLFNRRHIIVDISEWLLLVLLLLPVCVCSTIGYHTWLEQDPHEQQHCMHVMTVLTVTVI